MFLSTLSPHLSYSDNSASDFQVTATVKAAGVSEGLVRMRPFV